MDPTLFFAAGVIVIVVLLALVARSFAQAASRAAGAIDTAADILKEVQNAQVEEHENPKSLAATTSLVMPQIQRDFPEFNLDEMKTRAANCVTQYLRAIDEMDAGRLEEGTPQLHEELRHRIAALRDAEQTEEYKQVKVHRTEISGYSNRAGRCVVSFQCATQSRHVVRDRDGNIVKGFPELWDQQRWQTDLLYVQDADAVAADGQAELGLSCPNCGAPVKKLGSKVCEYCGTGIVEINLHAWNFATVKEI